jgi:hypothetical protein
MFVDDCLNPLLLGDLIEFGEDNLFLFFDGRESRGLCLCHDAMNSASELCDRR